MEYWGHWETVRGSFSILLWKWVDDPKALDGSQVFNNVPKGISIASVDFDNPRSTVIPPSLIVLFANEKWSMLTPCLSFLSPVLFTRRDVSQHAVY